MTKKHTLKITEIPGQNLDLPTAQARARQALAADLAALMRVMVADGRLIIVDGQIIPNPERTPKQ